MGGSNKTQTSQQSVAIPSEVLAQYQSVNQNASQVAQTPFQTYGGEFVSPVNSEQQTGIAGTDAASNQAQPYFDAATGTLVNAQQQGSNAIAGAQAGTSAALAQGTGYNNAATGALLNAQGAGSAVNSEALNTAGNAGSLYNTGLAAAIPGTVASGAAANPTALNGAAINQYLSPYLGDVVGSTAALLNQSNQQAMSGQTGNAISQGAFGGDRAGIAAATLAGQQTLNEGNVLSGLLNTGYNTALSTAQQQQGVGLAAQQANLAREGTAAAQLNSEFNTDAAGQAGLAGTEAGIGNQIYTQGANTATGLAGIGQQQYAQGTGSAAQEAALGNQAYTMGANTSAGLAGLGTGAQTAALQGAQAQIGAGTLEQQTQQAQDTAQYNQFLQQQSYPFQTAQFLANIAEGTGSLSGSTTTTTQPGGFFSDERLKEDIKAVGKTYDGQTIYSYKYKGDPRTQIGLLAQEVEKKHPKAVGLAAGYKTVDYKDATDKSAQRGHFYKGGLVPANSNEEEIPRYANGGGAAFSGLAPSGVNPMDLAALLQAQEGMYAPFSSTGLYGGQASANPYGGGAGRVPAGTLPVSHLQVAGGLPAQPSELEQASQIASLAGDGASGFNWLKKQMPSSPSQSDLDAGTEATDAEGNPLKRGGVAGYADGGMPYSQQTSDDSLDIPDQTPQNKLATANGSLQAPQSGLGQVSQLASTAGGLASAGSAIASLLPLLALATGGVAGRRKRDSGGALDSDDDDTTGNIVPDAIPVDTNDLAAPGAYSTLSKQEKDALNAKLQAQLDASVPVTPIDLALRTANKASGQSPAVTSPSNTSYAAPSAQPNWLDNVSSGRGLLASSSPAAPGTWAYSIENALKGNGFESPGRQLADPTSGLAASRAQPVSAPDLPAFITPHSPTATMPSFDVSAPNQSMATTPLASGSSINGNGTAAINDPAPPAQPNLPRSVRNNNPGNIEASPWAQKQPGYQGSDGRFAIFDKPENGVAAMSNLLGSYGARGFDTPQSIIDRWAPGSDPAYAKSVAGALGVGLNDKVDMSDPAVRAKAMTAMTKIEAGKYQPGAFGKSGGSGLAANSNTPTPAPTGLASASAAPTDQAQQGPAASAASPSDQSQAQNPDLVQRAMDAIAPKGGDLDYALGKIAPKGGYLDRLTSGDEQTLVPFLAAIGAMGSAKTRSFGTALATGLLAGAETYPKIQTQQAQLGPIQQATQSVVLDNQRKLLQNWINHKSLTKDNISLADYAKQSGFTDPLPPVPSSAMSQSDPASKVNQLAYTPEEMNSGSTAYPDGKGGTVQIPHNKDPNYLSAYASNNAMGGSASPAIKASVDAANNSLNNLPANMTYDVNGNLVPRPGALQANKDIAYNAGLIDRTTQFAKAKNDFLQTQYGPMQEQLNQLNTLYKNYRGGSGSRDIAGLNGLVNMLDPDGSKGLAKALPGDWQNNKNDYDEALKVVSGQIAQQMQGMGGGAPATEIGLLHNAVANPDLGAGARRNLVVHMQAMLDQKKQLYDGFNPKTDNIDDYTDKFNAAHPYNDIVGAADKKTPHYAGEVPAATPQQIQAELARRKRLRGAGP